METWSNIIERVGFPIGLCIWLLWTQQKILIPMRDSLRDLVDQARRNEGGRNGIL